MLDRREPAEDLMELLDRRKLDRVTGQGHWTGQGFWMGERWTVLLDRREMERAAGQERAS